MYSINPVGKSEKSSIGWDFIVFLKLMTEGVAGGFQHNPVVSECEKEYLKFFEELWNAFDFGHMTGFFDKNPGHVTKLNQMQVMHTIDR